MEFSLVDHFSIRHEFTIQIQQYICRWIILNRAVVDIPYIKSYNKNDTGSYLCVNKISFFIPFYHVIFFHWICFFVAELTGHSIFIVVHSILNLWFASKEQGLNAGIIMESPLRIKVELPFMTTSAFPSMIWMNRTKGDSLWDNTLPKSNANAWMVQLFWTLMFFTTMVLELNSSISARLNVLDSSNSPFSIIKQFNIGPFLLFRPIFGVALGLFGRFFFFRGFWGRCFSWLWLSFFSFWHSVFI